MLFKIMENNIKLHILEMPRALKRLIVIIIDSTLAVFAVWFSYYLRTSEFIPILERFNEHYALPASVIAIVTFIPIFLVFKVYKTIFRYSGLKTLMTLVKAIIIYSFIYSTIFTVISVEGVPRTIGLIQPMIFLLLIILSRYFALSWLGDLSPNQDKKIQKKNALIFGAGTEGRELMMALSNNVEIKIIGFLDDDLELHDNQINGLNVYNPIDIKKIISEKQINEIFLVLKYVNRERRNDIVKLLRGENVIIRTLPSYSDVVQGRVTVNDINDLSVEDILGRDPVKPNLKLLQRDITNKIVLITGAGGSIGREICHKTYNLNPKKLLLLDHSEIALYNILEDLKKLSPPHDKPIEIIARLGSITDQIFIQNFLRETQPETIYHAAAYKHVPIIENNKFQGIKTNTFGTLILAKSAISSGVKKFVFISSDKAVRPTNVMGATKRLAEMILQSLSEKQNKTFFAIVRFGNVLDSSGSVVPLFKSQIKSGGPLTVTHIDMMRYFMTISEAAELVIQAGAMTRSKKELGISAPIYLLDMGKPVKIYDLAKLMIELYGLTVFNEKTNKGDIKIKITSMRPGEKLYEELLIGEAIGDTSHPKIKYAEEVFLPWSELKKNLENISKAIEIEDLKTVMLHLKKLVSGFRRNDNY